MLLYSPLFSPALDAEQPDVRLRPPFSSRSLRVLVPLPGAQPEPSQGHFFCVCLRLPFHRFFCVCASAAARHRHRRRYRRRPRNSSGPSSTLSCEDDFVRYEHDFGTAADRQTS